MTLSCGGVWKGKEKGEYEVIHSEVSLTEFAPPPPPPGNPPHIYDDSERLHCLIGLNVDKLFRSRINHSIFQRKFWS